MSPMLRDLNAQFTYKEYQTWPDNERWELIAGIPYNLTPAPSSKHQEVLGELHRLFATYLRGKSYTAYLSPFEVRFPQADERDEDISSVVQPDLTVIGDPSKIDAQGCKGAPDLVIEILSPATMTKDLGEKLRLYEKVGIVEYWVVHPYDQTMLVFRLNQGIYGTPTFYKVSDEVQVGLFNNWVIPLSEVFAT